MQMITSRANQINDVIISSTAAMYYNYSKEQRDKCEEQKEITNWAWWDLGVALQTRNPSLRSTQPLWPSTNDHLRVIHYLKSLYSPNRFRRKLMKELFILMRPLRLYKDNPTTLISKCMPQYWIISLKSLHYKNVINPSRIFTCHCHGGWNLCLRLPTNTHRKTKAAMHNNSQHQKQLSKHLSQKPTIS